MSDLDKDMSYIDLDDPGDLEVEVAMRQECGPLWQWDHTPDHWPRRDFALLVWLVHRGGAHLSTKRGAFAVKRGDFLIMPSHGEEYHGRHNPDKIFDVSWFFFRVAGMPEPLGGVSGIPFRTALVDLPAAELLMARLLVSPAARKGIWLTALLDEVQRQHAMQVESEAMARMRELGERIRSRPGRYRGLDDMLSDYPYSKDHLIRLFRACHGTTPVEFLIRSRVEAARALLTTTGFSVKQIAAQLGYADAFCFSRQFKARTGQAPSELRAGG